MVSDKRPRQEVVVVKEMHNLPVEQISLCREKPKSLKLEREKKKNFKLSGTDQNCQ